jgi:hypothetical protein
MCIVGIHQPPSVCSVSAPIFQARQQGFTAIAILRCAAVARKPRHREKALAQFLVPLKAAGAENHAVPRVDLIATAEVHGLHASDRAVGDEQFIQPRFEAHLDTAIKQLFEQVSHQCPTGGEAPVATADQARAYIAPVAPQDFRECLDPAVATRGDREEFRQVHRIAVHQFETRVLLAHQHELVAQLAPVERVAHDRAVAARAGRFTEVVRPGGGHDQGTPSDFRKWIIFGACST